jgi:hypothetical protein
MALAFDAVASGQANGTGPFTFSHTTSGANRLLVVGILIHAGGGLTVTAVTYNGVAMTVIPSSEVIGTYAVSMYSLIAPASGTNTVSISVSSNAEIGFGSVSFTGADQTTPFGTANTATGTSTTPSVTVSSATDEIVMDTGILFHSGTLSVGANQTSRWSSISTGGWVKHFGSTEPGDTSVTMSWSNTTSQGWAIAAVPVKPVSTVSTIRQLCLTGVGT